MWFIKRKLVIIITLLLLLTSTSCVVSKQQVGNYDTEKCKNSQTVKGKDFYLFWNQLPVTKVADNVDAKNYEIVVKRNAFDAIIFYGSIGVFSFYTVKIKTCEKQ